MPKKATALKSDELSEDLAKLRRGEITLDAYLDACVEGAVAHLVGTVDDDVLESVREAVRAQARMDPVVVAVVERLTRQDRDFPASG